MRLGEDLNWCASLTCKPNKEKNNGFSLSSPTVDMYFPFDSSGVKSVYSIAEEKHSKNGDCSPILQERVHGTVSGIRFTLSALHFCDLYGCYVRFNCVADRSKMVHQ